MKHESKNNAGIVGIALVGFVALLALILGAFYAVNLQQAVNLAPAIAITAPAEGDIWTIGSTQIIRWETKNIDPGNKVAINIRRVPPPPLQEEGQEFDPIVFVNLENTGSIDWSISDMYPDGTYVLGITSYASIPVVDPITAESAPFRITRGQVIGGDKDAHGCLIAAGYSWCEARSACIRPWETYCTATPPKTVVFQCEGGKSITATFYIGDDKFVDLRLSDGRNMSVPRAISASGARYAKADESFVFWNKGDTAFITEGPTTTFANCTLTD